MLGVREEEAEREEGAAAAELGGDAGMGFVEAGGADMVLGHAGQVAGDGTEGDIRHGSIRRR